ncbi:MAG: ABC transporter substrate-binding protein [Dehalococcoidia bacterium]
MLASPVVQSPAKRRGRAVRGGLAAFLALGALALLASACAGEDRGAPSAGSGAGTPVTGAAPATFPLVLRDSTGTEVRLAKVPERVISLSPGATEILFSIGAGDRVVGTDAFSDFPDAAAKTQKIDYSNPSPEAAIALKPDLVIMATRQEQFVAQFRSLGMTVFLAREPENLEGVYASIDLLGRLTGRPVEAARVSTEMRTKIEAVTASLSDVTTGPRVFFELDPTLFTVAPNSFVGAMLTTLKARNIAPSGSSPFPQVTAEAVLAADPEVIILSHPGATSDVGARPGWGAVSAVRNSRIYAVNPDLVNRPGPRLAEGIRVLALALYPDRVH